jgi:putative ABC transport system permease protein
VAINIINTSVLANFRDTIDRIAGPAALQVALGVGEVGFDESVVEIVRADPGVAAAVPLIRGTISIADESGETLQLFGADFTEEESLQRYRIRTRNRREVQEGLTDPRSILVTAAFANHHRIDVGEKIRLSTPLGVGVFTIRGLLDMGGLAAVFGGQLAVMDLPAAQLLLQKEGRIDQVDIVLQPNTDLVSVEERLERALPETLTVIRPDQRGLQYESILGSFQAMLTGLSLLCLVAGVYIVYNTTWTGATHRALSLAGLRLIGATTSQLFRLLICESLVLGIIGVIIGVPIGIALARLLVGMVADSMSVIFQLRFPVESISVNAIDQLVVASLGILAAVFACYFAARRVTRLEPLDVMRADLRTIVASRPSVRLIVAWIVSVVIAAAAIMMEIRFKSIQWGNFGSTLWFASSILVAIPLVTASAAILSRVLPRFFGAGGRVAAESLLRSPTRTGITVAAIALLMTVGLTADSLATSLSRSIGAYFSGGFLRCDLAVSAVATEGGWLETPLPETLGDELLAIPGVRSADLIRIIPGHIYRGQRVALGGGSPTIFDPERYPPGWYRAGDAVLAAAPLKEGKGANISVSLADRFDLQAGDPLDLDTPRGKISLVIVGIVPDYMSDRGSIILNRQLLVDHWGDHSVNRIHLFLQAGAMPETVRRSIADRLGQRYRLKLLEPEQVIAFHTGQVDRAFSLMKAIQLLIIVVTVAGILDLLLSAILERRRELSLWRVIGAAEATVRRSVVVESVTIGLLGAMLGIVLGVVTAWIWVRINFRYLLGYYLDYHFAAGSAVWLTTLVMIMTLIAGWVAAINATRQSVLDGLRIE